MIINPKFKESLGKALHLLRKNEWEIPLLELEEKFSYIDSPDVSFSDEILNMLLRIRVDIETDSTLPLTQLAAIRLAALDCWNWRFVKKGEPRRYLDPLQTPVSEFEGSLEVYLSSCPYPPPDIIKRWALDNLK